MTKKKSNDKSKVSKFNPDGGFNLFQSLVDDVTMDHSSYMSGEEQVIGHLAASAMNAAVDLSKLVIENRTLNSQKMNDEDIYKIFRKSFKSIIKITTEEDHIN